MTGGSEEVVRVGEGDFSFEAHEHWAQLPEGWSFVEVAGVASDSLGRIHVFNRGEHPVIVFNRDGQFLRSWGEGIFTRAHGITIGPDDSVYLADDLGHTVRKFTLEGKLLLTLGTSGSASATGAIGLDYRTIRHAGPPFNLPTNLALSPRGEMYVTDGYGNARVHKFSPDGRLLFSWGGPGSGPGQFHVPHGIAVGADGTVHVADRENCRIQIFTPEGEYLREWGGLARPCELFIDTRGIVHVAELGFRSGMWPGAMAPQPRETATGGRVSVFDLHGKLLARWGGGENPCAPGDFFAPHDIWADAHGDVYVSEVTMSAGGNRGLVSRDCHTLQKFVRARPEESIR